SDPLRQGVDQGGVGRRHYERAQQLPRQESRAGWLREAQVDNVIAVVIARLSEYRFAPRIVLQRIEPEFSFADLPAAEGAGRFFDVALGIVSDVEAKELHHFAGEVFVRLPFAIRVAVEPD